MCLPMTPAGPESEVMKPIFTVSAAAGAAATTAARSPTKTARPRVRTRVPPPGQARRRADARTSGNELRDFSRPTREASRRAGTAVPRTALGRAQLAPFVLVQGFVRTGHELLERHRPRGIEAGEADAERQLVRGAARRSEEHTSELQSHSDLVCRLRPEKKQSPCRA